MYLKNSDSLAAALSASALLGAAPLASRDTCRTDCHLAQRHEPFITARQYDTGRRSAFTRACSSKKTALNLDNGLAKKP